MTGHLTEILSDAVPEPPRSIDSGTVLRAARRRQSRRRALTAAVAVAAAFTVALPLANLPADDHVQEDLAGMPRDLTALDERVPLGDVALGALEGERLAHPGEGTLVGVVGDDELWLLETQDAQLCLLSVYEKYGSAAVACTDRAELLHDGVMLTATGVRPDAPLVVAVAVPDGYTRVAAGRATAKVRRNVALLAFDAAPRAGAVTVRGPGLATVTFPLDDRVPPGSATAAGRDAGAGRFADVRLVLTELMRRAERYAEQRGDVTGFVASLPADRRAELSGELASLTDGRAVSRAVDGTCLVADLRSATLQQSDC